MKKLLERGSLFTQDDDTTPTEREVAQSIAISLKRILNRQDLFHPEFGINSALGQIANAVKSR